MAIDWRTFITYPEFVSPRAARELDTLAELVPIVRQPDDFDKLTAMFRWFTAIKASGLVSGVEMHGLRAQMSENQ